MMIYLGDAPMIEPMPKKEITLRLNFVKRCVAQFVSESDGSCDCNQKLMLAIFEQILKDAYMPEPRMSYDEWKEATEILAGEIVALEIMGVDSGWVRRKIKEAGLPALHVGA